MKIKSLKKVSFLIVVIAITLSLSSCIMLISGGIVKRKSVKKFTVENGVIPPEFGKTNSILLVVKSGRRSFDKTLTKVFDDYKGNYLLVNREDLTNSKLSDIETYRFIFDTKTIIKTNMDATRSSTRTYQFFMRDRIAGKKYDASHTSSFYGKLMKAYVINLNELVRNY